MRKIFAHEEQCYFTKGEVLGSRGKFVVTEQFKLLAQKLNEDGPCTVVLTGPKGVGHHIVFSGL